MATVTETESQTKRKASTAGLSGAPRPVKRRASKACCCCRARKVRCDVVENGSPCTNCRLDQVECVVTESKRRKKSRGDTETNINSHQASDSPADTSEDNSVFRKRMLSHDPLSEISAVSPSQASIDLEQGQQHMPHLLYQTQAHRINPDEQRRRRMAQNQNPAGPSPVPLSNVASSIQHLFDPSFGSAKPARGFLPDYIRGLPQRLMSEDIDYLAAKGALTIPELELRNELLKSYIHYVHAYMPLLDLEEFLHIIARNDGIHRMSLLLFQAVMFAGTAFIDLKHLQAAGFQTRKAARKVFFQRARLLYDFDYEVDRISLVQSLLLMTYWYETPDDQKDTWHWMGVSLSLAHTIGLHRDPGNSGMDVRRQRLWKRIWWSTYTRDRLIALGMRRPMRIKDDDCDVPMLTLDDFEFKTFPPEIVSMVGNCELLRSVHHQRELGLMFIEKAKLCLCVSHVLSAQYSVLSHKFGGTTETTMMLVPKKSAAETFEVRRCDQELEDWQSHLPPGIQYTPAATSKLTETEAVLHLHRALLKMVYLTTSSALHRPQVLPASPFPTVEAELQDLSRNKVRRAAIEITHIAQDLHRLDLTRFLPTTGVTVLLPAVIIHLLDIKSNDPGVRMTSLQRFYQCMRILQRLREIYASADFATSFLEAAIRKAGIQLTVPPPPPQEMRPRQQPSAFSASSRLNTLTPPPDSLAQKIPDLTYPTFPESAPQAFQNPDDGMLFASTPPHSVGSENGSNKNLNPNVAHEASNGHFHSNMTMSEFMDLANDAEVTQNDFDALINFDDAGADLFAAEDGLGLDGTMNGSAGQNEQLNFGLDFSIPPSVMNFDDNQNKGMNFGLGASQLNGDRSAADKTADGPTKDHGIPTDLDVAIGLDLES
ncbi:transcriptional regulator family: Fungal Specific TF [Paecilomyces variotii]|nr:transcriptional regulator family: Fungal Specific TF [Paecilomyces variotii]